MSYPDGNHNSPEGQPAGGSHDHPGGYGPPPGGQAGGYGQPHPQQPGPQGNSDEQTMALLAHIGGLLTSVIVPLILYLLKREESGFVRHHALEALNFQIMILIASVVAGFLMFLIVGFLLLPIVYVVDIVLCVLAAVAANRGEWYRYPVSTRLVS